jgi:hypothetical protein
MVAVLGFEPSQFPDLGIIEFIRLAMHIHLTAVNLAPGTGFEPAMT